MQSHQEPFIQDQHTAPGKNRTASQYSLMYNAFPSTEYATYVDFYEARNEKNQFNFNGINMAANRLKFSTFKV